MGQLAQWKSVCFVNMSLQKNHVRFRGRQSFVRDLFTKMQGIKCMTSVFKTFSLQLAIPSSRNILWLSFTEWKGYQQPNLKKWALQARLHITQFPRHRRRLPQLWCSSPSRWWGNREHGRKKRGDLHRKTDETIPEDLSKKIFFILTMEGMLNGPFINYMKFVPWTMLRPNI